MKNYAKVDNNNIVREVIVFGDDIGPSGPTAPIPENWHWIETSESMRNKLAGRGDTYNEEYDVFLSPKPAPSWTLNTENFKWEPPVPMPEDWDDVDYIWNEETQSWDAPE
jgi:hypothetical protein